MEKPYLASILAIVTIYLLIVPGHPTGAVPMEGTVKIKDGTYVGPISPMTQLYISGWDVRVYKGRVRIGGNREPKWMEMNYPRIGDTEIIIADLNRMQEASIT